MSRNARGALHGAGLRKDPVNLIRTMPAEGSVAKEPQIQINGQSVPLPTPLSLNRLLENLRLRGPRLAVAVNGEIVTRSQRDQKIVQANDQVEIIQAVAGG